MYQKLLINQEIPQWVIFRCLDLYLYRFLLKSAVSMACEFSFDSLDIIGFISWMKFSIVGFELLFLGGL